jgi:5'(3')-deoxyribonucleotidase
MKKVLLLDMDGVLADFHGACCRLFGTDFDAVMEACPERPHEYAIEKYLSKTLKKDISDRDLWERIDKEGQFWLEIEPYPWMDELWDAIRVSGMDVIVSTSPGLAPWNASHKITWLRMHLPELHEAGWMIGKHKHLMAKPFHWLLDDCDHNIMEFRKGGGNTITFPQPWNHAHTLVTNRIPHVLDQLRIVAGM